MNFPFLKDETFGLRNQKTFIGNKCEFYVPQYFFDKNDRNALAKEMGDRIETIGLLWFTVEGQWYQLKLPLKFQFQYTETRKETKKLRPEIPEMEFRVFTLRHGDAFMYDELHKQRLEDLSKDFLDKLIENAKLPRYISYNETPELFVTAMQISGYPELGVSSVSIEFMLSELYRNKNNLHEPFRKVYNEKNKYNNKMIRLVKIPQLNSTMTSIMGEDINNQLVASVLRNRENIPDIETPIEKILKY